MTVSRQSGFLSSMSERRNESESQTPFRETQSYVPLQISTKSPVSRDETGRAASPESLNARFGAPRE